MRFVKGGQGRSGRSLRETAYLFIFSLGLLAVVGMTCEAMRVLLIVLEMP